MSIPASLFRSYDIRGLAPGEIDELVARRLAKALVRLYRPKKVVVGRDMRATSLALEEALIEGFLVSGVDAVRAGLCSTPMFYCALGEHPSAYDLGVMITASHNPSEYNGFKILRGDLSPVSFGMGMEELRDLVISDEPLFDAPNRGTVSDDAGLLERYVERVWAASGLAGSTLSCRVAVDTGNGMNGLLMPKFKQKLAGVEMLELYWDLDSRFPHHEANPMKGETLEDLKAMVVRQGCQFGVAFDGDGDRVGFVDERGEQIPGDILTVLFGQMMLARATGPVVYDVRASWSVPDAIRAAGGEPVMSRVGRSFIHKLMCERKAIFGGEGTMHFYFPEFWCWESSDYAMLLMVALLARTQRPLSVLWRPLVRYAHLPEINYQVKDALRVIQRMREVYTAKATTGIDFDGVRLEFCDAEHPENDWWFNLRASNTEPLLRLNIEARTEEKAEAYKRELEKIIQESS